MLPENSDGTSCFRISSTVSTDCRAYSFCWGSIMVPGIASTAGATVRVYVEATIDPSTATPSAPPISRVVSLTADPAPASSTDTAPITDSVAGPCTTARPSPMRIIAISTMPA